MLPFDGMLYVGGRHDHLPTDNTHKSGRLDALDLPPSRTSLVIEEDPDESDLFYSGDSSGSSSEEEPLAPVGTETAPFSRRDRSKNDLLPLHRLSSTAPEGTGSLGGGDSSISEDEDDSNEESGPVPVPASIYDNPIKHAFKQIGLKLFSLLGKAVENIGTGAVGIVTFAAVAVSYTICAIVFVGLSPILLPFFLHEKLVQKAEDKGFEHADAPISSYLKHEACKVGTKFKNVFTQSIPERLRALRVDATDQALIQKSISRVLNIDEIANKHNFKMDAPLKNHISSASFLAKHDVKFLSKWLDISATSSSTFTARDIEHLKTIENKVILRLNTYKLLDDTNTFGTGSGGTSKIALHGNMNITAQQQDQLDKLLDKFSLNNPKPRPLSETECKQIEDILRDSETNMPYVDVCRNYNGTKLNVYEFKKNLGIEGPGHLTKKEMATLIKEVEDYENNIFRLHSAMGILGDLYKTATNKDQGEIVYPHFPSILNPPDPTIDPIIRPVTNLPVDTWLRGKLNIALIPTDEIEFIKKIQNKIHNHNDGGEWKPKVVTKEELDRLKEISTKYSDIFLWEQYLAQFQLNEMSQISGYKNLAIRIVKKEGAGDKPFSPIGIANIQDAHNYFIAATRAPAQDEPSEVKEYREIFFTLKKLKLFDVEFYAKGKMTPSQIPLLEYLDKLNETKGKEFLSLKEIKVIKKALKRSYLPHDQREMLKSLHAKLLKGLSNIRPLGQHGPRDIVGSNRVKEVISGFNDIV